MTTTHDATVAAFLADICEYPDDDASQLIFADWLDEHGQPERGEFIRVQCELARVEQRHRHECTSTIKRGMESAKLKRRERELLDRWVEYWLPEELGYTTGIGSAQDGSHLRVYFGPESWCVFRRGFVAEVRLPLAAWIGRECERCRGHGGRWDNEAIDQWYNCSDCDGSGRVDACGPALVLACPLLRVETDASPGGPMGIDERWWYNADHPSRTAFLGQHMLPGWLFKLLQGGELDGPIMTYHGEDAANAALSESLLAWATPLSPTP